MRFGWVPVLMGVALPAAAQYAGPAILTRGEAPTGMTGAETSFRPFVEATATYNTGLAGVSTSADGDLPTRNSFGNQLAWGVSGRHSWQRTVLGLSYRGNLSHYWNQARYDSVDESLMIGLTHRITRHISLSLRESAGIQTRDFGLRGLQQTVPFDPSTTYTPSSEFFDNRTIHSSTQANLVFQRSARLSFSFGGGFFNTRHRSAALRNILGVEANGDTQYRLSRRVTVGGGYTYRHFEYAKVFGGTDIQGAVGSLAVGFTRNVELSGYAGFMRVESKFVQTVPIDPAIAALLGITYGTEVVHNVNYIPHFAFRLSRTFPNAVASVSAGHTVTPGNGLFLTSYSSMVKGSYNYTGLRRWSFNSYIDHVRSRSTGQLVGDYLNTTAGLSMSRKIRNSFHFIVRGSGRRYGSRSFANYNRTTSDISVGIGYTPGDIPLRVW